MIKMMMKKMNWIRDDSIPCLRDSFYSINKIRVGVWFEMVFIVTVMLVMMIDQVTKYYITKNFFVAQSLPIIRNVFHITYVQNPGAAFGILKNKTLFFIIISIVIVVLILIYLKHIPSNKKLLRFGLSLQIGGALGNLVDRVKFGYVIDFLDFRIWPVFNMADMAIVFGVGILIYEIMVVSEKRA